LNTEGAPDAHMDPADAKKQLRIELAGRETPPPARFDDVGKRVCALLLAERAVLDAGRIALYAALPDEVSTRPLFEEWTRMGRTCLFPRMLPDGRLAFAAVDRLEDLRPGRRGIAEPPPERDEVLEESDVVIVPGVAFDRSGTRLGRGGGYYDRTFPVGGTGFPRLIGATYADRILESLPSDSHDHVMDAIVTQREFCWTRSGR